MIACMNKKQKMRWLFLLLIVSISIVIYIYIKNNPVTYIRTEISQVEKEEYESIGGLSKVKDTSQQNFKHLTFKLKVTYPDNVQNVHVEMSKTFSELLGHELYWYGSSWEYPNPQQNELEHFAEAVIYVGETTKDEIVKLLNDGRATVYWEIDGEEKSKEYHLGDTVVFK